MSLNTKQKKFRIDRAQDLTQLAELFDKIGIPSYKLRDAAKDLTDFNRTKKVKQEDEVDYSYWGYNIDNFEIPLIEPPKHIQPKGLNPISVLLSIDFIASCDYWGLIYDPLKKLEFNISVKGYDADSQLHHICYHIDRHLDSESEEPHPMYHLHFGGKKMDFDNANIGHTIFLDAPRVMFYPTDLIIGFDFVLSNFFPDYWNQLLKESTYNSLLQEYYSSLVKPFVHTLASQWPASAPGAINWSPNLIFPQLKAI